MTKKYSRHAAFSVFSSLQLSNFRVDDVDEAIKLAEEHVGKDYKILLMPQGSLTVPVLKK